MKRIDRDSQNQHCTECMHKLCSLIEDKETPTLLYFLMGKSAFDFYDDFLKI